MSAAESDAKYFEGAITIDPAHTAATNQKNSAGVGAAAGQLQDLTNDMAKRQNDLQANMLKKLGTYDSAAIQAAKHAAEDHTANKVDYEKQIPLVTNILDTARPLLDRANEAFVADSSGVANNINAVKKSFDTSVDAANKAYTQKAATERGIRTKQTTTEAASQFDLETINGQWITNFAEASQEKAKTYNQRAEAAQGKNMGIFTQTEDFMDELMDGHTVAEEEQEAQQEDLESEAELLEESGNQDNPGIDDRMNAAEDVFDEFNDEATQDVDKFADESQEMTDTLEETAEKMTKRAGSDSMAFAIGAENAFTAMLSSGAIATKTYGDKVKKTAEREANLMNRQLPRLPVIAAALSADGKAVWDMHSKNEEALGQMKAGYDDELGAFSDKFAKQLHNDALQMMGGEKSFVANSKNLLLQSAQEKTDAIGAEGAGAVQAAELSYESFLSGRSADLENSESKLGAAESVVKKAEDRMKDTRGMLARSTKPLETINTAGSRFDQFAQSQGRIGISAGMDARAYLGKLAQEMAKGVSEAVTTANTEMSEVSGKIDRGIASDAGNVMSEVNDLATNGVSISADIRGQMTAAERQMEDSVKSYSAGANLVAAMPGDVNGFVSEFQGQAENANFSNFGLRAELAEQTNETFANAIDSGMVELKSTEDALAMSINGDAARVSGEAEKLNKQVQRVAADAAASRLERRAGQLSITKQENKVMGDVGSFGPSVKAKIDRIKREMEGSERKAQYAEFAEKIAKDKVLQESAVQGKAADTLYKEEVETMLGRFGRKTTGAIQSLQTAIAAKQRETEAAATGQSAVLVDSVAKMQSGTMNELHNAIHDLSQVFAGGKMEQALASCEAAIAAAENGGVEAEKVTEQLSKIKDDIQKKMKEEIDDTASSYTGALQSIKGSMTEGTKRLQDEQHAAGVAMMNKIMNSGHQSDSAVNKMNGNIESKLGSLTAANRDIKMGASALTTAMQQQAADTEKAVNENMKQVLLEGSDSLNEASHERAEVQAEARQLERQSGAMSILNAQLERDVEGALEKLNPSHRFMTLSHQIEQLKKNQVEDAADEKEMAENANRVVGKLNKQVQEKIARYGADVSEQNKKVAATTANVAKEFGSVSRDLESDDLSLQSMLQDMHEMANDMKDHVYQREHEVELAQRNNDDVLANMQGLTEYGDANILDKVRASLSSSIATEAALKGQVDGNIKPQFGAWHEGIEQVFGNLGASLDLDKITANAAKALALEKKTREEISKAGGDLESFLRASQDLEKEKQREIQQRTQNAIQAIMRNAQWSMEEKLKRVQEINAQAKRDTQILADVTRKMQGDTDNAKLTAEEQKQVLETLLQRAKIAAAGAANPMDRRELSEKAYSVNRSLKEVKTALQLPMGMQPSLIEVREVAQVEDEKVGAIKTVADDVAQKSLRVAEESAEWEKALDHISF